MTKLELGPTEQTPYVLIDIEQSLIVIRGKSFPDNPDDFYSGIFKWWDIFSKQLKDENRMELELDYFNVPSIGYLLKLLKLANQAGNSSQKILIDWVYENGDEDIMNLGKALQELMSINLRLKEKAVTN